MKTISVNEMRAIEGGKTYTIKCSGCGKTWKSSFKSVAYAAYCLHRLTGNKKTNPCFHKTPYYYWI